MKGTKPIIVLGVALALWWVIAWAAARALIVEVNLPHADAIFVLAGAPVYFERTAYAGQLYRDGRASKIILTNDGVRGSWSRTLQRNPLLVERAILRLTQAGVPAADIEVLDGRVSSTYDEAVKMRHYAQLHSLKSIVVVTSPYHSRRAAWTLRRICSEIGLEVGIEPAPPLSAGQSAGTWWWYGRGWQTVPGEYAKFAYYRLWY